MRDKREQDFVERKDGENDAKPPYTPPTVRLMEKDEVLKTFQVTSASISWWTL